MKAVMEKEFANLDPDINMARKQHALLRDELVAKEEATATASIAEPAAEATGEFEL